MTQFALIFFLLSASLLAQDAAVWSAQTIHWQQLNPDGSKYAVLEGNRDRPGTFTYAFFLPNGGWVAPHFHNADARVFVASGTLLLGEGERFDKSRAKPLEAGSFFLVLGNARHWEGARGDTLIIGVANGPWKTTNLGK